MSAVYVTCQSCGERMWRNHRGEACSVCGGDPYTSSTVEGIQTYIKSHDWEDINSGRHRVRKGWFTGVPKEFQGPVRTKADVQKRIDAANRHFDKTDAGRRIEVTEWR